MVAQWLLHLVACQDNLLLEADILRGGAYLYLISTWSYVPLALTTTPCSSLMLMAVISQLLGIEFDANSLGLAWAKRDAGKSLQLDRMQWLAGTRRRYIYLSYFVGLDLARIGNLEIEITRF